MQRQLPGVALAEGNAFVAVGSTGATVSGAKVTEGVGAAVGAAVWAAVGFAVGIVALPRSEQVQPVAKISSASSGIKKNRFICASPFGSFPIVCAPIFKLCKNRMSSMRRKAQFIRLRNTGEPSPRVQS